VGFSDSHHPKRYTVRHRTIPMKIILNSYRTQQHGGVWLLLVIILAIIFIGLVGYIIVEKLEEMFPQPPTKEDEKMTIENWRQEWIGNQQENGETNYIIPPTCTSISSYEWNDDYDCLKNSTFTLSTPTQGIIDGYTQVERSTNLIHWEIIAITTGGQFRDTNPPSNCAFYRQSIIPFNR
jgi:hypothetical protein